MSTKINKNYDTEKDRNATKHTPEKEIKKGNKEYICKRCKDPFYTNKELSNHLKKLTKCKECTVSSKILPPCECKCGDILSSPYSLTRHMKICSKIKDNKQVKIENNIPFINSLPQNNTILPYTHDFHIASIKIEEINILESSNDLYLSLFKIIYCDKDRPQYHNIFYSLEETQTMLVYDRDYIWKKLPVRKVINTILFIITNNLRTYLLNILHNKKKQDIINKISTQIKLIDENKVTAKNKENYTKNFLRLNENIKLLLIEHEEIIFKTIYETHITESSNSSFSTSSDSSSSASSDSSLSDDSEDCLFDSWSDSQ
jgi:hypothetical protein